MLHPFRIFSSLRSPARGRGVSGPRRAFTLLELAIGCLVLSMFMIVLWRLFTGGQKVASKGQWITISTDQLRTTTMMFNASLMSTAYPTTLLPDGILDSGANQTLASKFYIRFYNCPPDAAGKRKLSVSTLSGRTKIMKWYNCAAEHPKARDVASQTGRIQLNEVFVEPISYHGTLKLGKMELEIKEGDFTTTPPNHVLESGAANNLENVSGVSNYKNRKLMLVEDVRDISWLIPDVTATQPMPLKIEITTQFPKDANVIKMNSILVTPNVAIQTL